MEIFGDEVADAATVPQVQPAPTTEGAQPAAKPEGKAERPGERGARAGEAEAESREGGLRPPIAPG
jgi:hypothetical protein